MIGTGIASVLRGWGAALPVLMLCVAPAAAQYGAPPAAVPGGPGGGRNPACLRLESQLAMVDRGSVDPATADQVKRYEAEAGKQQAELDRLSQQSQRLGCRGGGFFSLFSGQPQQCTPLNNQIQQIRSNIDRYLAESQRLQGNTGEREGQRRGILAALGQNVADLLITDLSMPWVDGEGLAATARKSQPGLRVLLISGYARGAEVAARERVAFLPKPFDANSLCDAVDLALTA